MRKLAYLIVITCLLVLAYTVSQSEKDEPIQMALKEFEPTQEEKPAPKITQPPSEIKKNPTYPIPEAKPSKPKVIQTPKEKLKAQKKNIVNPQRQIRILLPKSAEPVNGFFVVVPTQWEAPDNPKFNPLLRKYQAPWSATLNRRYPENELENSQLPYGNYDVLLYKNDSRGNKPPTLVNSYEVSSGGLIYIDAESLRQLKPL